MKVLQSIITGVLLTVSLGGSPVHAEQTPEQVLQEIIDKIKKAQNASPVVDYVDWPEAFASASEKEKAAMNLNSPDEMKTFYRQVLTNPTMELKKQFEARLTKVPDDQRKMMEQSLARMEQMMQQKELEMKKKIAGTDYEIGEAKIEGDTAVVKLKQTYEGATKEEEVTLVKKDGVWRLPSVGMIGQDQKTQAPAGAAPPPGP